MTSVSTEPPNKNVSLLLPSLKDTPIPNDDFHTPQKNSSELFPQSSFSPPDFNPSPKNSSSRNLPMSKTRKNKSPYPDPDLETPSSQFFDSETDISQHDDDISEMTNPTFVSSNTQMRKERDTLLSAASSSSLSKTRDGTNRKQSIENRGDTKLKVDTKIPLNHQKQQQNSGGNAWNPFVTKADDFFSDPFFQQDHSSKKKTSNKSKMIDVHDVDIESESTGIHQNQPINTSKKGNHFLPTPKTSNLNVVTKEIDHDVDALFKGNENKDRSGSNSDSIRNKRVSSKSDANNSDPSSSSMLVHDTKAENPSLSHKASRDKSQEKFKIAYDQMHFVKDNSISDHSSQGDVSPTNFHDQEENYNVSKLRQGWKKWENPNTFVGPGIDNRSKTSMKKNSMQQSNRNEFESNNDIDDIEYTQRSFISPTSSHDADGGDFDKAPVPNPHNKLEAQGQGTRGRSENNKAPFSSTREPSPLRKLLRSSNYQLSRRRRSFKNGTTIQTEHAAALKIQSLFYIQRAKEELGRRRRVYIINESKKLRMRIDDERKHKHSKKQTSMTPTKSSENDKSNYMSMKTTTSPYLSKSVSSAKLTRLQLEAKPPTPRKKIIRAPHKSPLAIVPADSPNYMIHMAGLRLLDAAAIPIQTEIRRFLAEQEARSRMWACVIIQTYFRRWLSEDYVFAHIIAAIKIQAAFRGWVDRDRLEDEHYCATEIQKIIRGFLGVLNYQDDLCSVSIVQTIARRKFAIDKVRAKRNALIKVQALYRGFKTRNELSFLSSQAIKIQTLWRRFSAQLSYQFDLVDVIITQSVVRRWIIVHKRQVKAAIVIQRYWRGYCVHLKFLLSLVHVIVVQVRI